MIASLKGTVSYLDQKSLILDVNDVGYRIHTTNDIINSLSVGDSTSFFTHLAVREDAMDLYGFPNKKELEVFGMLISVSGIGPKGAINILSSVSIETLTNAIRTGSTAHLTKVSGIGKKTSEKIILELKDKIASITDYANTSDLSSDADAIEALKMLGYNTDEARESLKKIDRDIIDTGEKIKAALKVLN